MKLLFQSTDPSRMAFAKAMLQGEGIASFELDVHTSMVEGGLGILPRRLMVVEADHALATRILHDLGLLE